MKILHICNDYPSQKLYKVFFTTLSSEKLKQNVFVPVRSHILINKNNITNNKNINISYFNIIKKYHRFLFNYKIKVLTKKIKTEINLKEIEIIHAHTLFSNGAVALKLKKELNVPYIVAVRNTDVNAFFKYMLHLRKKGVEILLNAEHIVFITPAYIDKVLNNYIPESLKKTIQNKITTLPNGVDPFWLKNKINKPKTKPNKLKILYVGDFSPNKNVNSIIQSIIELNNNGINISLVLVGGGGTKPNKTMALINKVSHLDYINYYKRTSDKNELLNFYRENDILVMPSFKETFGVVYLEAMSQGLSIIFSKNQGVDGYFKERHPGYAVDPNSINDIKLKIIESHNNLQILSENSLYWINKFDWLDITNEYKKLYNSILKK